ncbi:MULTISPECIES: LacI family DNA-binding transcriptional regulator [Brevundimonas]|uniref:LacI family DNA-binding transcriptional regulator n=1 Tax=Brevundimonas TaxID=41275 RepID=UPI000F02B63F|nr:LacI family DNA-binding transcriptional regulator [Brevundimonas lutea]
MGTVTIKDVAREAGVSLKTVSRVANNEPNVTAATRERVSEAIERLGYVPNMAARRMGGARSYLLVAFNDRRHTLSNWESGRGNDWVDQMLHGAMLACERLGWRLMFDLVDGQADDLDRRVSGIISSLQPDGVILTPPHSDDERIIAQLRERGIRFVRMGTPGPADGERVFMDDEYAALDATRLLVRLGHRRIGFIEGSARFAASESRKSGFVEGLAEAQARPRAEWVQPGDFTFDTAVESARTMLTGSEPPTAILAANDESALAVLSVAHDLGISVPGQLSIISFDDTPGVRSAIPPMTAIRQPIAAMAARAAEMLIARSRGEEPDLSDPKMPHRLVERASTAPPPL